MGSVRRIAAPRGVVVGIPRLGRYRTMTAVVVDTPRPAAKGPMMAPTHEVQFLVLPDPTNSSSRARLRRADAFHAMSAA